MTEPWIMDARGQLGGYILMLENAAPCYTDDRFLSFVDAGRYEHPARKASPEQKAEGARRHYLKLEEEMDEWCGSCPLRDLCLERGIQDNWTGPAGGKWLTNGRLALPGVRAVA